MARVSKIDQFSLDRRVLDLIKQGKKSPEIAAILTAEGVEISQPTVSRWLKKQRDSNQGKIQDIIQDHVEKTVPADLDALELMEQQCLDWAQEGVAKKAERIGTWLRVKEALPEWRKQILDSPGLEEKEQNLLCRSLVAQCLSWAITDAQSQKQRLAAMKMAESIISTKLRFAGVIEDTETGRIYIQGYGSNNEPDDSGPKEKKGGLFSITGGNIAK